MRDSSLKRMTVFWLLLFVAVSFIGCGGTDDPRDIHISGTVKLQGKAIKTGKIFFTPDAQKGNKGPMGVAKIRDGKFNTNIQGGRGVVGGPHKVKIENYVDAPGDGDEDLGVEGQMFKNPIANGHYEDWDIPKGESEITKDFDIKPTSQ